MTATPLRFGLDRVLAEPQRLPRYRAIGLVTNHAARPAVAPDHPGRLALRDAGFPIVRLFGPEHGLSADAADGAAVDDALDALTGLPVVSLYGARMRPTADQLDGLDAVLFDVPDVGARFYTYLWTLWHVMGACESAGLPLHVLDRPNPLGGDLSSVEGPFLEPACRSFIGEAAIPIRHGLTFGELATYWRRTTFPSLTLDVVRMAGWEGRPAWPDTGCRWVQTSPAMPHVESAIWYPGLCLFEATNLSVGRGTPLPFTAIGAPWLDAAAIVDRLTSLALPGVQWGAGTFTPSMPPHDTEQCHVVELHVVASGERCGHTIRSTIRPVRTALHLLRAIRHRHPEQFAWSRYVTAANPTGANHFARLIGTTAMASLLDLASDAAFEAAIKPLVDAPRNTSWGLEALLYSM